MSENNHPVFYQNAEDYIRESEQLSTLWWKWLPWISVFVVPLTAYVSVETYRAIFENEFSGVLELCHAIFPFIASLIALRLLLTSPVKRDPLIAAALVILCVGGFYLAGEEISWGQHHFGWATPEYWSTVNYQSETNLHNTSPWANQIPRAVLVACTILGGTIFPYVKINHPGLVIKRLDYLYPPRALFNLAMIIVLLEVMIQIGNNFDLSGFVKYHDGELMETYVAAAVLLYAIVLQRRSQRA